MPNKLSKRINHERFNRYVKRSSEVGRTDNNGLHRLALSQADKEIRDQLKVWFEQAGLTTTVDDFGNMYGRREGKNPHLKPIVIGSHLDTQPYGGRFDGVLGVLAGLEVVESLNDDHIQTERPIVIVNFTNEEGARFPQPMLGSGAITEHFNKSFVYEIQDEKGITFEQALQEIGYVGKEEYRLKEAEYYLELHIEQGPMLERNSKQIGVVGGIQGMDWLDVNVIGEKNHAGPTAMEDRKDALASSARMISTLYEITNSYSGLKTTVGKLHVHPNVANVVPGNVEWVLDVRHEDDTLRMTALDEMRHALKQQAALDGTSVTVNELWASPAVLFDEDVLGAIEKSTDNLGLTRMKLYSGAGHDSKYMPYFGKTGMIFIPSVQGVSHREDELSHDHDLHNGVEVLLHTVMQLDAN
ncbi:M20 family metallo-hydrolase [Geomicrobium sediminis]|uniref:N-carbamoyl-L-amino-acid hydrolase n=1 Tax=Geomicrobium sediminis TaxID=1347788 RepID=A0ABS2PI52_9BACL|nr:M20 family metallo-hydrolase [Geomicrobium sediminis]MBM7634705.1 N-carbamoyl-L-amino-acid hydrolase [Geomicrobium sediminis]